MSNNHFKVLPYPSGEQLRIEKRLVNQAESKLIEMSRQAANEDMSWRDKAECNGYDSDIFFSQDPETILLAKNICQPCPVQQECLDYALRLGSIEGVWGGLESKQINRLRLEKNLKLKTQEDRRENRLNNADRLKNDRQDRLEELHYQEKKELLNPEEKKKKQQRERDRERSRQYHLKNKNRLEKLLAKNQKGQLSLQEKEELEVFEKAKKQRREYERKYYQENKAKIQKYKQEYYFKKTDKKRQQERLDRLSPQEKIKELKLLEEKKKQKRERNRRYYHANKEKILQRQRQIYHRNKKMKNI